MYLYIMGRGHSGSTILDILLGSGSAVESVGELSVLGRPGVLDGAPGAGGEPSRALCSCGAPLAGCPFWARVRERFAAAGGGDWRAGAQALHGYAHVRNFWRTLRASRRLERAPAGLAGIARITAALEGGIAAASGKPHLLDSNKDPTRALFLLKYHPGARVIHLVRDPRGVVQSYHWRLRAGHGFSFLRRRYGGGGLAGPLSLLVAAGAWTAGNLLCEAARRAAPDRVLRLRYEDLRDHPAASLRRIGAAFDVPVGDIVAGLERDARFPVGHNVGGNRIRHDREVRFDRGTERTRPPLPRWAAVATLLLCWPLMRRYGYPVGGPARGGAAPSGGAGARTAA